MNRDEQRQILGFIARAVGEAEALSRPIDVEADAIIRAMFVRNPEAAYRVMMLAISQELELAALRARPVDTVRGRPTGFLERLFAGRRLRVAPHEPAMPVFERTVG